MYIGTGRIRCGASRSRMPRSASDSRTRPNSPCSWYRSPPWISREERPEVPAAKSSFSTSATEYPRAAASRAMPTPVIPPPMTSTSNRSSAILARLAVRVAAENDSTSRCYRQSQALLLGVAAEQHHRGDRDEGGGEDDEDAGLDALERPEAAGRLVGDERAVMGQGLYAGRRRVRITVAVSQRCAGGRQGVLRDAVPVGNVVSLRDRLAVRAQDALGEFPVGTGWREAAQHAGELGNRGDVCARAHSVI